MEKIYFKNDKEIVEKLKEMGVFTKTKTEKDLHKLNYKNMVNKEITSSNCEVIAYNKKTIDENCINKYYENLAIKVKGKIFNINIDYFKDMQKKSFGMENKDE